MKSGKSTDERWMKRALAWARRGEGLTRPNPPVGAMVVKNGQVIGEGFHRRAGGPHAEVYALRQAGEQARGATLYVTLEPCSTTGRTPPCTEAIHAAGIREVVMGALDPNPRHAGRALQLLRQAGIRARAGVLEGECEALIAPFACWMIRKRPFVTLKLGMTLDGCIADRKGVSQWITGPEARDEVHALRRRADAVLVGAGTVRTDDPSLLPRPDRGRRPYRIIVSRLGKVPSQAQVFVDAQADQTLLAVTSKCSKVARATFEKRGVTVITFRSWSDLMKQLAQRDILHVVCEGGGEIASALVRQGLVDEYRWFVAPSLMGGRHSKSALDGKSWPLADMPKLRFIEHRSVGPDLLIRARPQP